MTEFGRILPFIHPEPRILLNAYFRPIFWSVATSSSSVRYAARAVIQFRLSDRYYPPALMVTTGDIGASPVSASENMNSRNVNIRLELRSRSSTQNQ